MKTKIAKYESAATQLGLAPASKTIKKTTTRKETTVMYRKGDFTWPGAACGRKSTWVFEALEAGEGMEKHRV